MWKGISLWSINRKFWRKTFDVYSDFADLTKINSLHFSSILLKASLAWKEMAEWNLPTRIRKCVAAEEHLSQSRLAEKCTDGGLQQWLWLLEKTYGWFPPSLCWRENKYSIKSNRTLDNLTSYVSGLFLWCLQKGWETNLEVGDEFYFAFLILNTQEQPVWLYSSF